MFTRLKQLFQRQDREADKPEVHTRERDSEELRAEAQHYANLHHGNIGGGNVGGPGGGS
jgi:hypothetical protein